MKKVLDFITIKKPIKVNETWQLAERIAKLVHPKDYPNHTKRYLRLVKSKRWEILHAFDDLKENPSVARFSQAYFFSRIKYWSNI